VGFVVVMRIKNIITAYGSAMLKILKQVFIGPAFVSPEKPTYNNLADQIKNIWNDKSVGLERIVKLFLVLIQFANPFSGVCHCFDRISAGAGYGYLFTDFYVILKLIVSLGLLSIFRISTCAVLVISVYIIIETVLYVLKVVFVSSYGNEPISSKRSLLILVINYFTITLSFAAIYTIPGFIPCIIQPINAVYFSFVISSTLGLGNYVPIGEKGQIVVISQIITTILFLMVFFTYFLNRLQDKS
jgi:hypothetical protein